MSEDPYASTRDLLPDWVAGRLSDDEARRVAEAVERDEELAADARLLETLLAARPEPPAGLAGRITGALEAEMAARPETSAAPVDRRVFGVPRWSLLAAAGVALLLVTLEVVERVPGAPEADGPLDQLALEDTPSPWVTEDEAGTGAPVLLDDLSDEALSSLLEELGG